MTCCNGSSFGDADRHFDAKKAAGKIASFREKGPDPTTRLIERSLAQTGMLGGRLLDIGSGVGALTFTLLERGMSSAVAVDASAAYMAAAVEEAGRRERAGAIRFVRLGNAYENGLRRLKKNPFRTFIHPVSQMRDLIARKGFHLAERGETWEWCVDVYTRRTA